MTFARAAWMLAWLAGVSGCRTLSSEITSDSVRLKALRLSLEGEERGEVRATLSVDNASKVSVNVSQVDWEVWLEGHCFASGTQVLQAELSPRASTLLSFRAPVGFHRLREAGAARKMDVGLRGHLVLGTGRPVPRSVPFEARTRIEVEGAPTYEPGEGALE